MILAKQCGLFPIRVINENDTILLAEKKKVKKEITKKKN